MVISSVCEVETDMLLSSLAFCRGAQCWSTPDKRLGVEGGGVESHEDSHLFFNVHIASRSARSMQCSSALQMTVRVGAS